MRLFAPTSVWNASLASHAALDATSQARMAALDAEVLSEVTQGIGPWITASSSSTPLYTVSASQPLTRVTLDGVEGSTKPLRKALSRGVPIPPGAQPAAGTDGHLTVYQPSTDRLWELWRASRQSDGWHASWGGAMHHVSQSPGYYTSSSWPGLTSPEGYNWGSTASSLPIIAGTIRLDELRRAHIDHALALGIPDACARTFSWPAQRTDGGSSAADCIPEGAHLRIDPRVNLATLNLPSITLELAKAAQRYGLIVRDVTHHAIELFAEDPTPTGGDPYHGPNGFFGGLPPWKFLPQFPWDRLQLLHMSSCTQAPCAEAQPAAVRRRTGV